MVVDTSALCAVLFGEPDAGVYAGALASPGRKFVSSVTMLEVSMVVEARLGEPGTRLLAELAAAAELDVVAFDSGLAEVAFDAWRRYGKGRHPAGLNFGDCGSYALAKVSHQTLLFKGQDFAATDVPAALV